MVNNIKIRQLYFTGLFSSIFYFAFLLIILGKVKSPYLKDLYIYIISFTSILIPYFVFQRFKNVFFKIKNYKINLILGHIPLVFGFIFSLFEKNYIYILIAFPIFFINYLILIPWRKDGLSKAN